MSAIFITFILFSIAVLIFGSLTFFIKNDKKKRETLFLRLSQEGTANNLTFCSQEILQNKVIGIDGIRRRIMILERIKNKYNCSVISLDEVQNCEVVTNSGFINAGSLKRYNTGKKLDAIELQFKFKNQAQPASIIFCDGLINSKKELALLKAKAEYWSVMLSKMLSLRVRVRA